MKKIYILFSACILLASSCGKQLVENPKSAIGTNTFYSNDAEAVLGVNGVYSWLGTSGGFKSSLWRALDEGTDVIRGRIWANDPVPTYQLTSFNPGYTSAIWTTMYRGISNANLVIDKVSKSAGVSKTIKDRVIGETKFLRSLYYYYLTGLFGDVVYYDETNYAIEYTQSLSRISAADIREKLVEALTDAESKLPAKYAGADAGRATKGAAQTLLTKIYLWQKKWDLAQKKAQAIVDSKTYLLQANYADIFLETGEFGPETIFEVDFEPVLNGHDHSAWYQPQKQVGVSPFVSRSWYGTYIPYTTFVNTIGENDKRRASIIATGYNNQPFLVDPVEQIKVWSGPKFWRLNTRQDNDGGLDMYVFRYADVLLMLAEAANESGDADKALWAVNEVRKRAFGATGVFTATLGQQAMRDYLFRERAVELYGEGQRRLDLIRWGKLVTAVKTAAATEDTYIANNIQDFHIRYPIPAIEIQKNPNLAPNNDGY
ncbi:Starch-binding associating with outer membrane [Chitinophaga eiseniae]|uniref:Starch-binding associating with outer membrane n=1 Tax=Chitinophaga eiseniae TaxID=634771 RepID=A0A1T4TJZ5_9BACT|nr:RagB/SusD family nutrient uptake outer membrane protein [Chitinophaga eiseniae]SKA40724.1 Starch-binding associating with outer membrane [Chitinophaga eiseniae]